jgi:hypothetical protein
LGAKKRSAGGSKTYAICDQCGRNRPITRIRGKCVQCKNLVCVDCGKLVGGKVYCAGHAPVEKQGCFIATAAYGTPLCDELDTLRRFRDRTLALNPAGRGLVSAYYRASPPLAGFIAKREKLREMTRHVLDPIVHLLKQAETQASWPNSPNNAVIQ